MVKSKINILIVAISITILGLIVIQVFWVKNALILKNAQFDQDVRIAMRDVAQQVPAIVEENYNKNVKEVYRNESNTPFSSQTIVIRSGFESPQDKITPKQLDSLIKREFSKKGINTKYVYGVFNQRGQPVFYRDSSSKAFTQELLDIGFNIMILQGGFFDLNDLHLSIFFPKKSSYVFSKMWLIISVSVILILIVVYAFYYTVNTIFKQKQLSEIKNDFINNMTHELKTPISTIQLACEALKDPDMVDVENKDGFVDIIHSENKRLGDLVETVLKTAVLDKGKLKLKIASLDLNDLVGDVVNDFKLKIKQADGKITVQEDHLHSTIEGDHQHISNVIRNLIDNAIKYSSKPPEISIKIKEKAQSYCIQVADKGIGIKKENIDKIFDKLYRVPTGDVHDVKGFGLGLNYVKSIVEAHGGKVTVKSTYGKGSIFAVCFPKQAELN